LGAIITAAALAPRLALAANPRGSMDTWASDGATAEVIGQGREPVVASRVALEVAGGAVIVHWALSYEALVTARSLPGDRYPEVGILALAALDRDGQELARWTLGETAAKGAKDQGVAVRLAGTGSGLWVDRPRAPGRRAYVFKVWNERARPAGTLTVTTRTMVCEER
jgi:hypothetical protein